jgi:hypothetical protein
MSSLPWWAKASLPYGAPVLFAPASSAKMADRGGKGGASVAIKLKRPCPSYGAAIKGSRR